MERITTGIPHLDLVLGGGFPRNSLNIIAGSPGTGKTILAQQLVSANARPGARALYLTTLSEPSTKMLRYLQRFPFFDQDRLLDDPPSIVYRDIASVVRDRGFAALPDVLDELFQELSPSFLVIDSFKALRDLAQPGELRRPMFALASSLAARACTVLLVGEYTAAELAELAEFAIADGIVHLVNRPLGTRDERFLRILKLRGSGYLAGEHAFRITGDGLAVFPRLVTPAVPAEHVTSAERVSTGVPGLDLMVHGGFRRGSSTLVVGSAGTGKSLLGVHFLYAGVAAGEHGLLVNFQENPSLLRHLIGGLGFATKELDDDGRLTSVYMSPVEMNIDEVVRRIVGVLETKPVTRVVIDSLGDLETASSDPLRFRSYLYALMQLFAVRNVTCYATMESLVAEDYASLSRSGVSYFTDNVIALRYMVEPSQGQEPVIGRSLSVVKCRGSAHDHHVRRLAIGPRGVTVGVPRSR